MESDTIDTLLERYLNLLDEYTSLRTQLSQLQTSMFQNLARANFSAERGMRYGPDFYDQRMQATRRLEIITKGTSHVFNVARSDVSSHAPDNATASSDPSAMAEKLDEAEPVSDDQAENQEQTQKQKPKDPLRWFGILTPLALRQTQSCAIKTVDQVIPRLVSVNAAMQDLEIQVRRARKKRVKAEVAAAKTREHEQQQHSEQEQVIHDEVTAS